MPRPVPRRRAERDAPAADEYTSRRGRRADAEEPDDEPAEERRPRRGRERGELPTRDRGRAAAVEPEDEEPPSRRRGRRAPEPEPEDQLPGSLREVKALSDDDFDALVEALGLDPDAADEEEVWEAIQAAQEPEEPPARGRGRGRRSEPEEPPVRGRRGRSSRDDDEDDEDGGSRRTARRGFQGFKKAREATSSFADDFKLTDEEVLVKFLPTVADAQHVKDGDAKKVGDLIAAEPFATYGEHGLYKELNEGQRVWPCLAPEEDCPVCNTGHNARAVALWNIVVIPEDGAPQLKVLKAGPKLEKLLEKKSALKTGPLDKEYYSLSQTAGKNDGPVEYTVELVRERDLADPDGWATEPFTEEELDEFIEKAYDASFVKFPSQKDMKDVARKLRSGD